LERKRLERKGFKELFFVLAHAKKHLDFTMPPAVALLNYTGFFRGYFLNINNLIGGNYI
jgi:hypothetical protein